MRKIYKHRLKITDEIQVLTLPPDSIVVHCGEQEAGLYVWVDGDVDADEYIVVPFRIFGTGHLIKAASGAEEDASHVGTVQMSNGFVWHIYEI